MSEFDTHSAPARAAWHDRAGLAVLLVLAAALRLRGLAWGLPGLNEEAVPFRRAVEMWGAGSGAIDLNPHFFFYPALTFYLHLAAQALTGLVGLALGWWQDLDGFRTAFGSEPGRFILVARGLTVLAATLAVVPVWRIGRRLGGAGAGWGAALVMSLAPLSVNASRYIVTDIPLMLAVSWALWTLLDVGERGLPADSTRAGVAVGLATACKFTGLFLLLPLLGLHRWPLTQGPRAPGRLRRALLAALGAFALASPWILLDLPQTIATLVYQQRHQALGHFGGSGGLAAVAYASRHIPAGFGVPLALAALAACLTALRARGAAGWLALTGLALAVITGVSRVDVDRYLLPLLPIVAVLVPWAAARWARALPLGAAPRRAAPVVLVLILLLPVLPGVWMSGSRLATHDATRREAVAWMRAHVAAGSLVAAESYSVEAVADSLPLLVIPFDAVDPNRLAPAYSLPFYAPFDYIVLSSAQYDRYRVAPLRYPAQIAFYEGVVRDFDPVATFEAGPQRSGPTVRIFHRKPGGARPDFRAIPASFYSGLESPRPLAGFLLRLGTTLNRAGRDDLALAATEQALALSPEDEKALMNLGALRARRGDFVLALRLYERALARAPGEATILYNLGQLYQQKDDCREALKYFLTAQRQNPRLAETYLAMAICQVKLDYFGPARQTLRRFLESFPGHPGQSQARAMLRELEALR